MCIMASYFVHAGVHHGAKDGPIKRHLQQSVTSNQVKELSQEEELLSSVPATEINRRAFLIIKDKITHWEPLGKLILYAGTKQLLKHKFLLTQQLH